MSTDVVVAPCALAGPRTDLVGAAAHQLAAWVRAGKVTAAEVVDLRRSPGGSSGGPAASVAALEVALSVGTDTGGSIREPAAQCGLVGMSPSPGLVPVCGMVPFAPELDRCGPLARNVADAALLLSVLADRPELAGAGAPPQTVSLAGLRVGLVRELCGRRRGRRRLRCRGRPGARDVHDGGDRRCCRWPAPRSGSSPVRCRPRWQAATCCCLRRCRPLLRCSTGR